MAGYSGTPLPKKLGIKEASVVSLVRAPGGFAEAELWDMPAGARFVDGATTPVAVVLLFVEQMAVLEHEFAAQAARLEPAGGLWVAWPKKASGRATDLNENLIREVGLAAGLVDNKVCAVDDIWSGLRFVYRLADRKKL